MLFVVLMSMVLLALVWLLSVKLLEPMYNRRVLADLNHAADVYSAIIEKIRQIRELRQERRRSYSLRHDGGDHGQPGAAGRKML